MSYCRFVDEINSQIQPHLWPNLILLACACYLIERSESHHLATLKIPESFASDAPASFSARPRQKTLVLETMMRESVFWIKLDRAAPRGLALAISNAGVSVKSMIFDLENTIGGSAINRVSLLLKHDSLRKIKDWSFLTEFTPAVKLLPLKELRYWYTLRPNVLYGLILSQGVYTGLFPASTDNALTILQGLSHLYNKAWLLIDRNLLLSATAHQLKEIYEVFIHGHKHINTVGFRVAWIIRARSLAESMLQVFFDEDNRFTISSTLLERIRKLARRLPKGIRSILDGFGRYCKVGSSLYAEFGNPISKMSKEGFNNVIKTLNDAFKEQHNADMLMYEFIMTSGTPDIEFEEYNDLIMRILNLNSRWFDKGTPVSGSLLTRLKRSEKQKNDAIISRLRSKYLESPMNPVFVEFLSKFRDLEMAVRKLGRPHEEELSLLNDINDLLVHSIDVGKVQMNLCNNLVWEHLTKVVSTPFARKCHLVDSLDFQLIFYNGCLSGWGVQDRVDTLERIGCLRNIKGLDMMSIKNMKWLTNIPIRNLRFWYRLRADLLVELTVSQGIRFGMPIHGDPKLSKHMFDKSFVGDIWQRLWMIFDTLQLKPFSFPENTQILKAYLMILCKGIDFLNSDYAKIIWVIRAKAVLKIIFGELLDDPNNLDKVKALKRLSMENITMVALSYKLTIEDLADCNFRTGLKDWGFQFHGNLGSLISVIPDAAVAIESILSYDHPIEYNLFDLQMDLRYHLDERESSIVITEHVWTVKGISPLDKEMGLMELLPSMLKSLLSVAGDPIPTKDHDIDTIVDNLYSGLMEFFDYSTAKYWDDQLIAFFSNRPVAKSLVCGFISSFSTYECPYDS